MKVINATLNVMEEVTNKIEFFFRFLNLGAAIRNYTGINAIVRKGSGRRCCSLLKVPNVILKEGLLVSKRY